MVALWHVAIVWPAVVKPFGCRNLDLRGLQNPKFPKWNLNMTRNGFEYGDAFEVCTSILSQLGEAWVEILGRRNSVVAAAVDGHCAVCALRLGAEADF